MAVSKLDQQTAEHFAETINKLKGKVTMLLLRIRFREGCRWMRWREQHATKVGIVGEEKA